MTFVYRNQSITSFRQLHMYSKIANVAMFSFYTQIVPIQDRKIDHLNPVSMYNSTFGAQILDTKLETFLLAYFALSCRWDF